MMLGLALAWAVILAGCWLGWQLLRQNGRILLRLDDLEKRLDELEFGSADQPEGLPLGSDAPAFELTNLAGGRKALAQFRGQQVLLIFFNPECGFCREMMPKLAAISSRSRRGDEEGSANPKSEIQDPKSDDRLLTSAATEKLAQIIILTTGDTEKNRQLFAEHKLECPVLLQKETEVATAYQTTGTPSGYLIGADGTIASQLAMGAEALLALATGTSEIRNPKSEIDQSPVRSAAPSRFNNRSLARSKIKRDGLKAGTSAPDFRLPRLDGRGDLALNDLRGRRALLIFSSSHCGPCNTLAPELEKFHRQHPELEMLMISRGEPKENRAKVKEYGLTFPVVLQQHWEISRRYAMFATPVAYLIDEQGVIAHDVAVGADSILDLLARAERLFEQAREGAAV